MAESKYSDLSERIEKTLATTVKIERIDHLPKGVGVTVKKAYDSMVGAINIDLRNLRTLSGSNRELGIRVSSACYGAILRVMRSNNLIGTHVAADSVTALYTVSDDSEVRALISMAASLSSLIRLLNIHYSKKNLNNVTAGIGVSVSRGLRIGFRRPGGCRGSVWAFQCIGEAKELSKLGSINSEGNTTNPVVLSQILYDFQRNGNLSDDILVIQPFSKIHDGYHGDIRGTFMEQWIQSHFYD